MRLPGVVAWAESAPPDSVFPHAVLYAHVHYIIKDFVFPPLTLPLVALYAMDVRKNSATARVLAYEFAGLDCFCVRGRRHSPLRAHVYPLRLRDIDGHVGRLLCALSDRSDPVRGHLQFRIDQRHVICIAQRVDAAAT